MPTGKNWVFFIYINLAFIFQVFVMYYYSSLQDIKKNWPQYRCNPIYMPLSDNLEKDFVYCIQTMQSSFMGYILQPITYITSSLSNIAGGLMGEINVIRKMFDKIRDFVKSIIQSIYGVFLNIIIEFQKITIGVKDLIGKLAGVMTTVMFLIDGTVKTMQSGWNGPPGQLIRALGNCFHPETKIKLKNGEILFMKDVRLGDVIENGSKVIAVMKIDVNTNSKEKLYKLIGKGVNEENIYVTGSHLIYDNKDKKYKEVHLYDQSIEEKEITCNFYSCLITDDHKIQIGTECFWDWEDYIIKLRK